MKRLVLTSVLLSLALALTGCGVQTSAGEGLTAEAAATLNQVKAEMQAFASGEGERTIGDVKARLAKVDQLLGKARGEAKGLTQAVIMNVQAAIAAASGGLAKLADSAPVSALPTDFAATRAAVAKRFQELADKVGLK